MDDDAIRHLEQGRRRQALELLLERYKGKVFRLAFSILGSEADAEDMVQEVFLKLWRVLPSYDGSASLSTWIYAIARNTCLSRRRMQAARLVLPLDEAADIAGPPQPETQDLLPLLERLPEPYGPALRLFYFEEKSYAETAAMLGLPMGTLKSYIYRAKRMLAGLLEEERLQWSARTSKT